MWRLEHFVKNIFHFRHDGLMFWTRVNGIAWHAFYKCVHCINYQPEQLLMVYSQHEFCQSSWKCHWQSEGQKGFQKGSITSRPIQTSFQFISFNIIIASTFSSCLFSFYREFSCHPRASLPLDRLNTFLWKFLIRAPWKLKSEHDWIIFTVSNK